MKKMTKRIWVIFMLLMSMVVLVACSGGKDPKSDVKDSENGQTLVKQESGNLDVKNDEMKTDTGNMSEGTAKSAAKEDFQNTEKIVSPKENISNEQTNKTESSYDEEYANQKQEAETQVELKVESTPYNDLEIGINNIKFDYDISELSETQRLAAEYFNSDYMFVNSVEALQRYPKIFDKSLIKCYAFVYKIISYKGDDYEILACMIKNSDELWNWDSSFLDGARFILLRGQTNDYRYLADDLLLVYGRYSDVETITVDGVSLTIPVITVNKGYIYDHGDDWFLVEPFRFSTRDIQKLAKGIFGDDVSARRDNVYDHPEEDLEYEIGEITPSFVVEFDKPQNRRIDKLFFNSIDGTVCSANDSRCFFRFSEDALHFLMYYKEGGADGITVEYYDNTLNRIWKRQFPGYSVYSLDCDMTKYCLYLCSEGMLYTVNLETGEDVRDSFYIGDNECIVRKFSDGILLGGNSIRFVDLSGKMLWKTDNLGEYTWVSCVQRIDNRLIIKLDNYGEESYIVIDSEDGTIIFKGTVECDNFKHYG